MSSPAPYRYGPCGDLMQKYAAYLRSLLREAGCLKE